LGYFGIYDLLSDTSIEEYQLVVVTDSGDVKTVYIARDL
jgi:hypothetical protein